MDDQSLRRLRGLYKMGAAPVAGRGFEVVGPYDRHYWTGGLRVDDFVHLWGWDGELAAPIHHSLLEVARRGGEARLEPLWDAPPVVT